VVVTVHRCNLFHNKVGYRGQRYEVRYTDEQGAEHVFGWQNQPKDGLAKAARLHPGWSKVRVVDLEKEARRATVRRHS
jgi:hypothetical protein